MAVHGDIVKEKHLLFTQFVQTRAGRMVFSRDAQVPLGQVHYYFGLNAIKTSVICHHKSVVFEFRA